jgi:hypothetical protein
MQLRDGSDEFLDGDGIEMPLEAVASATLHAARDCIAGEVPDGLVDLNYRIDVENDVGTVVHSLRFIDAVRFKPLRGELRSVPF